eukprot:4302705-Pleurochrysis_carterae.AAC.1
MQETHISFGLDVRKSSQSKLQAVSSPVNIPASHHRRQSSLDGYLITHLSLLSEANKMAIASFSNTSSLSDSQIA